MFIRIKGINYFVIPEEKSVQEIYEEIFTRMDSSFISNTEKRKIVYQIKKQLTEDHYELYKIK